MDNPNYMNSNHSGKIDLEKNKKSLIYLTIIIISIIVGIIFCFKFEILKTIFLSLIGIFSIFASFNSHKEKGNTKKEITTQIVFGIFSICGIYFKFLGDFVLTYFTFLLPTMLFLHFSNINSEMIKVKIAVFIFICAISISIALNYNTMIYFFNFFLKQ
jgi:hypothetical protein